MGALVTLGEVFHIQESMELDEAWEEKYWATQHELARQVKQIEERIVSLMDGRADISSYVNAELQDAGEVTEEDRQRVAEELRQSLLYQAESERAELLSVDVALAMREQEKEEAEKEKLLKRCVHLLWEDDTYVASYLRGKILWQKTIDEDFLKRFIGFCSIDFNRWPGVEIDSKVRFSEKPVARGHETVKVINVLDFPVKTFKVKEYRTSNKVWYIWNPKESLYRQMQKSALRCWRRRGGLEYRRAFKCLKRQVEAEIAQLKLERNRELKEVRKDINELYVAERRRNERNYRRWLSVVRQWWKEYRQWKRELKLQERELKKFWRKKLSRAKAKYREKIQQLESDVRTDLCLCRRLIQKKGQDLWQRLKVEEIVFTKSASKVYGEKKQLWERYKKLSQKLYLETGSQIRDAYEWLWQDVWPTLKELERDARQRFLKQIRPPATQEVFLNRSSFFGTPTALKQIRETGVRLFQVPMKWVREGDPVIQFIPHGNSRFLIQNSRFFPDNGNRKRHVWMERVPTLILEKKAWFLLDHVWNSSIVLQLAAETDLETGDIAVLISGFRNSNVLNNGLPILGKTMIIDRHRKQRLAQKLHAA